MVTPPWSWIFTPLLRKTPLPSQRFLPQSQKIGGKKRTLASTSRPVSSLKSAWMVSGLRSQVLSALQMQIASSASACIIWWISDSPSRVAPLSINAKNSSSVIVLSPLWFSFFFIIDRCSCVRK